MISMISCDIHRRRRGSLSEEEYETTFIGIREATVTGSGDCYAWDRQLALCKRRRDAHRGVVPGLSDSAGVCLESAWRLWRLTFLQKGGKRQMLWGMALRMVLLFLVLLVAATISADVFHVVAIGFLICYGLSLFLMIHMNLGKK